MKAHRFVKPCAILVGLLVGPAFGKPADRVVQYAIHVDPTNPKSRVQYVLSLTISAREQDQGWIGWQVENYTITEKAILGRDTVWSVDFPFVDTTDGLWWVEHIDPDNPDRSEFGMPAAVVDTAVAQDAGDPDLHFSVVGVPYASPAGLEQSGVIGAVDFTFSTTANPYDLPDDSGDGEPVDTPDTPSPTPTAG